jgi:tetratricopeptide (TPR) repeat protein
LDPTIPRDLETVVHKAIEREPARRYGDAGALAADLRRYVEGRPIRARRVRPPERAWRWCRRNPAVAGLAAAAFLAMALGTAVSTGQAIRARRAVAAERQANAAARAREAEMRAVLEFVEERVLAAARPEGQAGGLGREVTLRQALDAALPAVAQGFADQPLIEARLRRTLGQSYLYLGEPRTAAEHFEAARALDARHRGPDDPETLRSMLGLANSYQALGRHAEALKLFEETLALRKAKLGPDHPDTLESRLCVASALVQLGRGAEAAADCRRAADAWEKLGGSDADSLYNTACFRAVTAAALRAADESPAGAKQAEGEADRAMAWLERAVAAGFTKAPLLAEDHDLDALRLRADFKELLARLSTARPK